MDLLGNKEIVRKGSNEVYLLAKYYISKNDGKLLEIGQNSSKNAVNFDTFTYP